MFNLSIFVAGLMLASGLLRADTLDALMVGSAVADVLTTEHGLSNPAVREGNPLAQSTGARIGLKALATTGTLVATRHLERHGHKGWSKAIRIGTVVLWSGFAVNNVIRGKR